MGNIKGFKVSDNLRKKLFGIACTSLNELIAKGCKKLEISDKNVTPYLQDGTIIDDEYFETLKPQTIIILTPQPCKTGADLIYEVLKYTNIEILKSGQAVEKFFQSNIKEKIKILNQLVRDDKEEDFQNWIKGVDTQCRTKEDFMEMRCRERIRGYFHSAAKSLRNSKPYKNKKIHIEKFLSNLKNSLSKNKYEGVYFNRNKNGSLCDKNGIFICGGLWNNKKCSHNGGDGHRINPYLTREQRIIFSTWNLDHRIEKSRTIIPSIIEAFHCENPIDTTYIYRLLFTKDNLKIVHIVCHDKKAHTEAVIDPIFIQNITYAF